MATRAEQFELFLGGVGTPAFLTDPEGRVIAANAALGAELGRSEGWAPPEGAPPPSPEHFLTALRAAQTRVAGTGVEARLNIAFLREDGSETFHDCLLRPLHQDGRCVGVLHLVERRAGQSPDARPASQPMDPAASEHARLFSLAADTAGAGQFYFEVDTRRMRVSPAYLRIVGWSDQPEWIESAAFRERVHPDDLPGLVEAMGALVSGASPELSMEIRLRRGDGGWAWVRNRALRVDRSAQGLSAVICGSITDVTALKEAATRLEEAAEEARRARRRLDTLAENAPVALFEYRMSAEGAPSLPYFNARLPEMMGIPAETLAADGAALISTVPEEDLPIINEAIERTARTQQPGGMRFRAMHPEKGERHIIAWATPTPPTEEGVLFYAASFDVTEQYEAELRAAEATEELRRVHARLRQIADVAPIGLYEFRLDPQGRPSFPFITPQAANFLGVDMDVMDLTPEHAFQNILDEDMPALWESIELSRSTMTRWSNRQRVRHPELGVRWISGASIPRADADGGVTWMGALYDTSEDVERQQELEAAHSAANAMRAENERQAMHDGLTGLPNRRCYDAELSERIAAAQDGTGPKPCMLIRVDLDHFKYVNDTLGHEAGDLVLQQVAVVLAGAVCEGDFVARIGGDEFSILMRAQAQESDARALVARIQKGLEAPVMYDGRQCHFGASFGLARAEDLGEMGVEIQIFADAALYRAKEGGRSRLEVFTPALHRDILRDRSMATELHEALEREEFEPFFQPQVCARTGALHGAEVLLRWRHPTRGVLAPGDFMHVAEQLRLVSRIDRMMMMRSQTVLDGWAAEGFEPPKVSFNISSGRMHDPDVVETARMINARSTRITVELLESTLVEEESEVFRFNLDQIREAGIEIEIDDFGSGHASIVGLMQLSPDALKVDQRLVAPVEEDEKARMLVRAIVEIAETLGISTVAEGVETQGQARALREIGCDVLQGFLFARPLEAAEFLDYARRPKLRIA